MVKEIIGTARVSHIPANKPVEPHMAPDGKPSGNHWGKPSGIC